MATDLAAQIKELSKKFEEMDREANADFKIIYERLKDVTETLARLDSICLETPKRLDELESSVEDLVRRLDQIQGYD